MRLVSRFTTLACVLTLASGLPCLADLPAPVTAKLLVLVSKGIGQGGKVSTKDAAVGGELKNLGAFDGSARVAYETNDADVKADVGRNCCVIGNSPRALGMGAVLALVDEGGKPKFIISRQNMEIFGITFPDAVLRIATFQ